MCVRLSYNVMAVLGCLAAWAGAEEWEFRGDVMVQPSCVVGTGSTLTIGAVEVGGTANRLYGALTLDGGLVLVEGAAMEESHAYDTAWLRVEETLSIGTQGGTVCFTLPDAWDETERMYLCPPEGTVVFSCAAVEGDLSALSMVLRWEGTDAVQEGLCLQAVAQESGRYALCLMPRENTGTGGNEGNGGNAGGGAGGNDGNGGGNVIMGVLSETNRVTVAAGEEADVSAVSGGLNNVFLAGEGTLRTLPYQTIYLTGEDEVRWSVLPSAGESGAALCVGHEGGDAEDTRMALQGERYVCSGVRVLSGVLAVGGETQLELPSGALLSEGTASVVNEGTILGDVQLTGQSVLENRALVEGDVQVGGASVLENAGRIEGDVSVASGARAVGQGAFARTVLRSGGVLQVSGSQYHALLETETGARWLWEEACGPLHVGQWQSEGEVEVSYRVSAAESARLATLRPLVLCLLEEEAPAQMPDAAPPVSLSVWDAAMVAESGGVRREGSRLLAELRAAGSYAEQRLRTAAAGMVQGMAAERTRLRGFEEWLMGQQPVAWEEAWNEADLPQRRLWAGVFGGSEQSACCGAAAGLRRVHFSGAAVGMQRGVAPRLTMGAALGAGRGRVSHEWWQERQDSVYAALTAQYGCPLRGKWQGVAEGVLLLGATQHRSRLFPQEEASGYGEGCRLPWEGLLGLRLCYGGSRVTWSPYGRLRVAGVYQDAFKSPWADGASWHHAAVWAAESTAELGLCAERSGTWRGLPWSLCAEASCEHRLGEQGGHACVRAYGYSGGVGTGLYGAADTLRFGAGASLGLTPGRQLRFGISREQNTHARATTVHAALQARF